MDVRRFDDPAEFFAHAAPFLERREAEHNLVLGLRNRLLRDRHAFGEADPWFAVAESAGEIVGAAFRTPPHPLGLSVLEDEAAVDAFVDHLRGADLGGVFGPVVAAERFAHRWSELTGVEARVALAERIYEAREAFPPGAVPGRYREYRDDDHDVAAAWLDAFVAEALASAPPARQGDGASFVARRLEEPEGGLVVWEDGGAAVSIAGFGSPTPNGIRVGPVYTPPELRGRGYASALVGELTARLLANGRRLCFLFTDLANPTSNSIYQRVGYRPVADVSDWRFGPW
ncbi:MAG: GNAT family N-acetyltransferase [Gaiellaceae bacterium]